MAVLEAIAAGAEKVGEVAVEVAKKSVEVATEVAQKGVETAKEVSEVAKNQIENIKNAGDAVKEKIDDIKNLTPEQLREKMDDRRAMGETDNSSEINESDEVRDTKEGITDEQKKRIKEETGWSDEIIDAISSMREYEIYRDAGCKRLKSMGRNV